MSIYRLKPRFQALLRPLAARLQRAGATANQVTLAAAAISILLGAALCAWPERRGLFLLLPIWMFVRMALNAIDGMLAREHGQQSRLGGYLNELCDVVADAALIAPLAFVSPFNPHWVFAVVFLAALSEYAGAMGPLVGASRRYDGPSGKSDRAAMLGVLGFWIGLGEDLPAWIAWLIPLLAVLLIITTINRVRRGLAEP